MRLLRTYRDGSFRKPTLQQFGDAYLADSGGAAYLLQALRACRGVLRAWLSEDHSTACLKVDAAAEDTVVEAVLKDLTPLHVYHLERPPVVRLDAGVDPGVSFGCRQPPPADPPGSCTVCRGTIGFFVRYKLHGDTDGSGDPPAATPVMIGGMTADHAVIINCEKCSSSGGLGVYSPCAIANGVANGVARPVKWTAVEPCSRRADVTHLAHRVSRVEALRFPCADVAVIQLDAPGLRIDPSVFAACSVEDVSDQKLQSNMEVWRRGGMTGVTRGRIAAEVNRLPHAGSGRHPVLGARLVVSSSPSAKGDSGGPYYIERQGADKKSDGIMRLIPVGIHHGIVSPDDPDSMAFLTEYQLQHQTPWVLQPLYPYLELVDAASGGIAKLEFI